jgi:6-pyruvoyltetrahydropterin/6-carboxytetrahydropterin synthase
MTLIRITKEFKFEMAHALKGHDGPCRFIHGHSYELFVTICGQPIADKTSPELGMLIDFSKLKETVKVNIVDIFDHALVISKDYQTQAWEDIPELFDKLIKVDYQPTSENLVIDFVNRLKGKFPPSVRLHSLKLRETVTSYAEWFASDNE